MPLREETETEVSVTEVEAKKTNLPSENLKKLLSHWEAVAAIVDLTLPKKAISHRCVGVFNEQYHEPLLEPFEE